MSTQAPVLDWLSVNESWIGTTGGSGSNRNPDEDQLLDSRSPSEKEFATGHSHVLVVDDNEADVFLIREAIETTGLPLSLHVATDGEEAIRFFDKADNSSEMPCPALVILDINLPKRQGSEVLKYMRQSRKCADALVLVVSTSDSAKDREQMSSLGANSYFRKPNGYSEFMKLADIIKSLLSSPGPLQQSMDRTGNNTSDA
jgi:CheY-like chemotaxis protein